MRKGKASLQLLEGETASHPGLHVVLLRGAVDNGAEQSASGARSDRGSLRLAEQSAASLLSGLIEPGLHALIPVLLEVGIRQNVVVLHLAKIYGTVRHPLAGKKTIISKPTKDSYSCRKENHTRNPQIGALSRFMGTPNRADF